MEEGWEEERERGVGGWWTWLESSSMFPARSVGLTGLDKFCV